jgi:hypothetical protein
MALAMQHLAEKTKKIYRAETSESKPFVANFCPFPKVLKTFRQVLKTSLHLLKTRFAKKERGQKRPRTNIKKSYEK